MKWIRKGTGWYESEDGAYRLALEIVPGVNGGHSISKGEAEGRPWLFVESRHGNPYQNTQLTWVTRYLGDMLSFRHQPWCFRFKDAKQCAEEHDRLLAAPVVTRARLTFSSNVSPEQADKILTNLAEQVKASGHALVFVHKNS